MRRWLGTCLALTACAAPPDAATRTSGAAGRDSAGIRIIDNTSVSPRAAWSVSSTPALEIGAVQGGDPAALLDGVVGATRMSDGRIVIANGGTRELRFFSAQGQHLRSAGGQGQGPGEFRWLRRLGRIAGDTLIAADFRPGTLAWFDAAGNYLFTTLDSIRGVEPPLILTDGSLLEPLYESGGFGGEWESFAIRRRQAEQDGFFRPAFDLVRIARGNARRDTLGRFHSFELFKVHTEGPADATRMRPFARGTLLAFGPGRIYVAHSDSFDIRVYQEPATLTMRIRKPVASAPLLPMDRDAIEQLVARESPHEPRRTWMRRWLAEVPWPEAKPAIRALQGDALGYLWVAESARSDAPAETWSVFDPRGELLTTLELPAGLETFEIGTDYLLGLWRDPLGVEFIRLYTLTR